MTLSKSNLFKSIKVGNVELANRLVHAPCTRLRCAKGNVATDAMLEYYAQRAKDNKGLIMFEAATPLASYGYYPCQPIIETETQVQALKKIVDEVHKNGAAISLQLVHVGRAANPMVAKLTNTQPVAPSKIYMSKENEEEFKAQGVELKELSNAEVKQLVEDFVAGAKRTIDEAGFDFIEIHAAHMYLIDQFVNEASNQRTDEYGGSIENRARFVLELVDGISEAVGAHRVGIRFSPYMEFQGSLGINSETNPIITWGYILSELQKRADNGKELAYVSLVEPRIKGNPSDLNESTTIDFSWPRLFWKGVIVRAGGLLHKPFINKLESIINEDDKLLIASGRYFTSNPDLLDRLAKDEEFTQYERQYFYTPSNKGYLGFEKFGVEYDDSKDDIEAIALA
jgi:NADPH2 dehydrogenase